MPGSDLPGRPRPARPRPARDGRPRRPPRPRGADARRSRARPLRRTGCLRRSACGRPSRGPRAGHAASGGAGRRRSRAPRARRGAPPPRAAGSAGRSAAPPRSPRVLRRAVVGVDEPVDVPSQAEAECEVAVDELGGGQHDARCVARFRRRPARQPTSRARPNGRWRASDTIARCEPPRTDRDGPHAARLVDPFEAAVLLVIAANAAVLGLQTYARIEDEYGDLLALLNTLFLAFFVVELALRIISYGRRPDASSGGLDVFDFVAISAAFVLGSARTRRCCGCPPAADDAPRPRAARAAVLIAVPAPAALGSMGVLHCLHLRLRHVGWTLFGDDSRPVGRHRRGDADAVHRADAGELPGLPRARHGGRPHRPATICFISFVLVAAFIVLNLLIGVVLNSMEEARQIHLREELRERGIEPTQEQTELLSRVGRLRSRAGRARAGARAAPGRVGERFLNG